MKHKGPLFACAAILSLSAASAAFVACGGGGTATTTGSPSGSSSGSSGTASSSSGSPECKGSEVNCGGACVDTSSDPANCGSCGSPCDTGALCCAGTCVETAACTFSLDPLKVNTGWQNGGDWLTLTGQGFAAGMKVFLGDGRAAAKVMDPNTVRIKTPPGPLGLADVKIQLGTMTAVLKGGFTYQSGALTTPWQQKQMNPKRGEDPGACVMQDGRVLITGGTTTPDSTAMALNTAIIYTRMTDMVTDAANAMSTPRWHDSAVTLLSGKVLVVGGACTVNPMTGAFGTCNGNPAAADLFDPATNTFAPSQSPLNVGRSYMRSALLPDGRVLISSANDPSLEVYDPDQDSFTSVPNATLHVWGFMVVLRDGRVLFGGGDGGNAAAEVFDPDTDMITSVGPLAQGRSMFTAHTLPDGRVLVIGGASQSAGGIIDPLDTIEAFDPTTNTFSAFPAKLSIGRCWHASALVRDGTMLVMGGYTAHGDCNSFVSSVDQIDPVGGTVTPFDALINANTEWSAVTLLDGSVLGVGGGNCGGASLPDIDFLPGTPMPQ
jgi:hypothetical protein